MSQVETAIKWSLIGGVTIFSMYLVYRFFQTKGWIVRASLGKVATSVKTEMLPIIETAEYKIF